MAGSWTFSTDEQGVAHLVFNVPDEKMNTFSSEVLDELDAKLNLVAAEKGVKAMIIESSKPDCFAAGFDLSEARDLTNPEQARALVERGRNTFDKVANMPIPTVALVDGVCLGGGLELALACDYRLCTDHKSTKLGLPEVQLGLIPGWGGTTRLPRLIGLVEGLTMITSGKIVDSKKAYKLGIVDKVVAREFSREVTGRFVIEILKPSGRKAILGRRKRGWMPWLMESVAPIRGRVYSKARQQILKRTKGQYPAPLKALEVIEHSWTLPLKDAFRKETAGIIEMASRPETRQLINLFFANEALKKNPGLTPEELKLNNHKFKQCVVLGAGTMGAGIAWLLAKQGSQVRLKDLTWEGVGKGLQRIADYNQHALKRRKMTKNEHNIFMHRISGGIDNTGLHRAELVVEAIDERMELKQKVLPDVERAVPEDCIICTNTSSLRVTDIATCLKRPENFLGLHFFNPVNRMPLVEVVRGEKTSSEALVAVVKFIQKCGKTPVVVADCAGFLVNRILIAGMLEASRLYLEGVDMQRIDKLYDSFGMPMGPLRLTDEVGLDIALKASTSLEHAYGERMKVPSAFGQLVDQGLLGRKNGQGFYTYAGKAETPNKAVAKYVTATAGQSPSDEDIVDRGILLMVNEAARCLEEQVAKDPRVIDMASIMGFGFPPFRGGVLRYADSVGIDQVVAKLKVLEGKQGERFAPAQLLLEMDREGKTFYGER